jgi:hypothetical protein
MMGCWEDVVQCLSRDPGQTQAEIRKSIRPPFQRATKADAQRLKAVLRKGVQDKRLLRQVVNFDGQRSAIYFVNESWKAYWKGEPGRLHVGGELLVLTSAVDQKIGMSLRFAAGMFEQTGSPVPHTRLDVGSFIEFQNSLYRIRERQRVIPGSNYYRLYVAHDRFIQIPTAWERLEAWATDIS